jgi:hypothetical protein
MPTTRVKLEGPLFTGEAAAAADEFTAALAAEIAAIGQTWIKVEANTFDKSGRGGTGRAADGVELVGQGRNWVIRGGIRAGEYSWPWLEGTSKRNQGNKFKGYKTFSRTRARMRKQVTPWAQEELSKFIAQMGGEAL